MAGGVKILEFLGLFGKPLKSLRAQEAYPNIALVFIKYLLNPSGNAQQGSLSNDTPRKESLKGRGPLVC